MTGERSTGTSRRRVLRLGGAGLATAGGIGLAGCTSDLPLLGDDDAGDEGPHIDAWLVDPDPDDIVADAFELRDRSFGERRYRYQVPDVVTDNEERLSYDDLWGRLVRDGFNVPATELDWQLTQHVEWTFDLLESDTGAEVVETTTPEVDVLAGSFDPDEIETNLANASPSELIPHGSAHGFDCYQLGSFRYAVRDDYLVRALGDAWVDSMALLEAALAARWARDGDGESDDGRRWAEDADAAALAEHRGTGQFVDGAVFPPRDPPESRPDRAWEAGLVGTSRALDVDGETTDLTEVHCYETEADADLETLREHVDANRDVDDAYATLEEYSIERSGRVLVVTGTARTKAIV